MKSTLPIRSTIFWFAIGVMVFFTMAASSPQCARSDATINPVLETQAQSPCKAACLDVFKDGKQQEKADYRAAKALCAGDYDCLQEALIAHQLVVDELAADKDACFAACDHQQGIATGGQ